MIIKFLQLNIHFGNHLDEIIEFVKREDFDIVNFQEVTSSRFNKYNVDSFNYLKSKLGYEEEISVLWRVKGDKTSYFGNAIFFKKSFCVKDKNNMVKRISGNYLRYWFSISAIFRSLSYA